jgi:integrase
MPQDDSVLSRKYMSANLAASLTRHGIADASDSVAAVVGWVDFENPGHLHHLKRFARHPKFVGVRPMIQDIPDVDWMLRGDVQWAYQAKDAGILYYRYDDKRAPYSLRHTYATFALLYGRVSVYTLAVNMGTSVDMIEKHYGHVKPLQAHKELTARYKI